MRRPSIGRLIAVLFTATIVSFLSIDTTLACRFFMRRHACAPCPPVAACAPMSCYSAPASCGDVIYSSCGEVVISSRVVDSSCEPSCCGEAGVMESVPATPTPAESSRAPAPPAPSADQTNVLPLSSQRDRRRCGRLGGGRGDGGDAD